MTRRRATRPRSKTYYWRHVRCDGCERACRYRDFRAGLPSFVEVHAVIRAEHESIGHERCRHRYKRRGTILGLLHEMKLSAWEERTSQCILTIQEGQERLSEDDGSGVPF